MSPIGPPHNGTILRAIHALAPIVRDKALLGSQGSVRLDDYDEPQPDIYLLRLKDDFYTSRHAGPADIFLIIEIADSSLGFDQGIKMALYAETGVPEYWISDIHGDRVVAYSDPREKSYTKVREFHRGETITPMLLQDCPIPVDALLP